MKIQTFAFRLYKKDRRNIVLSKISVTRT